MVQGRGVLLDPGNEQPQPLDSSELARRRLRGELPEPAPASLPLSAPAAFPVLPPVELPPAPALSLAPASPPAPASPVLPPPPSGHPASPLAQSSLQSG
jgi:hypothetical protein